jgi:hypothetical protein
MTLITLANSLYTEESLYDHFDEEFEIIVSTAESLAAPSNTDRAPIFNFSLDQGVIQPLVMTALSCRHQPIRHRALSLLQSMASSTNTVTQEGGWDAIIFANAARRVVAIEEEGLDLWRTQRVPEHRRIHQVTVVPQVLPAKNGRQTRVLTLRMTTLPNGIDGDWEVNIETILFDEHCNKHKPYLWNLD